MATPDPAAMNAAFAAAVAARQQADADRARVAAMTAAYAAAVQAAAAQRAATQAAADAVAKYGAYARAVEQADDRLRRLSRAAGDGTFQRQATAITALNRQYDLLSSRLANQQRAADLASGAFARHAAAVAAVNRESAALAQQEMAAQLVAERGQVGAFRQMARPHLQTLGGLAGTGYGRVMGLVQSGFQGTAELAALNYQWKRLGTQLAAVAIPAFEKIGQTVGRVAAWFEKLNGTQQDQILKGGLVVAGFFALAGVVRVTTAAVGAFAGVVNAATLALGAAVAAGGGGAAVAAATAAGGGLAGRFAPAAVPLAVGAGLGMSGFGDEAHMAIGGYGAARGLYSAFREGKGLGGLARGAAKGAFRAMPWVSAGLSAYEAYDMYSARRDAGESRLGAGARSLAHGLVDFASFGLIDLYDKPKAATAAAEAEKKRRDPSFMGTGLLEAGDTAQLIQEKLLEATIRREGEDVAFRETLLGLMHRIVREAEERGDAVPASILEVMRRHER